MSRLARSLVAAIAAAALLGACAEERPDVVLVMLDTLRPDHLQLHGYERDTAPYLTRTARGGAFFANAFSSSGWTPPATASTLTGLYPLRHGLVHGFTTNERIEKLVAQGHEVELELPRLPQGHPTLAERFRAAGYATRAVATNVHVRPELGFDRGFDEFVHELGADAERVAEIVRGFEPARGGPAFLYLHLNDVHRPYRAREPWCSRFRAQADGGGEPREGQTAAAKEGDELREAALRYDSEIAFADSVLERMHAEHGWGEDTVLAFVSDHGEGFGEHGIVGHGPTLHGVVNRVLLALAGPGVPGGAEVEANVSLVDVFPTLLELADVPAGSSSEADGVSLVPLLREAGGERAGDLEDRVLFAHRRTRDRPPEFLWSVVRGPWKAIHDGRTGETELYHLGRDAAERTDLSDREPERVAELRALRRAWKRACEADAPDATAEVRIDRDLSDHLREVGYVGD